MALSLHMQVIGFNVPTLTGRGFKLVHVASNLYITHNQTDAPKINYRSEEDQVTIFQFPSQHWGQNLSKIPNYIFVYKYKEQFLSNTISLILNINKKGINTPIKEQNAKKLAFLVIVRSSN